MTTVWAVVSGLALVVLLLGLLVAGLLRSHAEILRRLEGIGAGMDPGAHAHETGHQLTLGATRSPTHRTPDIAGINPAGDPVVVSSSVGPDPLLIAFLSTTCSSCTVFWENLDRSEQVYADRRHRVLIVTLGEGEESPTRAQQLARGDADVVMSSQAWEDFEVPGAPYFVLVDPERGVIGEGSAADYGALHQFLVDSTNDRRWDETRRDKYRADAEREDRVDEELRRAGIEPGDPRLYPKPGQIEGDE